MPASKSPESGLLLSHFVIGVGESSPCRIGSGSGRFRVSPWVNRGLMSESFVVRHTRSRGLEATAYSPASNADVYRWRWGRIVLRQRRIVGRRWDIGVDRIGNVGAAADRNTPADVRADVGVGHARGLNDVTHFRNRRDRQHRYPRGSPRSDAQIHREVLPSRLEAFSFGR
jgi:hypothetical protein